MAKPKKIWLNDNMLIAGRTKAGKSYHFEHEILPHLVNDDSRPVIILDYKDQYKGGSRVHFSQIHKAEDLADIMMGNYTKGRKPKLLRIVAPHYDVKKIDRVIFRYLCNCTPKIFVMEEAHFFFEDFKHRKVPFWTKTFFRTRTGEHNQLKDGTGAHNMVAVTQYPNDIPSSVLHAFSEGHIFYLPPKSLKYLYDAKFLDDHWEKVKEIVSPFRSYKYYDVMDAAMGGDGIKNEGKDEHDDTKDE